MAGETVTTIIGHLTRDPEVAFTNSGVAYARFTVASTPRRYDPNANEWTDGDALFLRCTAWRQLAENIGETLTKGARVVVYGRLRLNTWQTDDGETRSSLDLDVDEVGPSLRYATATVSKTTHSRDTAPAPTDANDPWGNKSPAKTPAKAGAGRASGSRSGGGFDDEPPF
jgi:single-strand DNA-binding protein